jgi:hypothetical protein
MLKEGENVPRNYMNIKQQNIWKYMLHMFFMLIYHKGIF